MNRHFVNLTASNRGHSCFSSAQMENKVDFSSLYPPFVTVKY